ncbi:hypothetical protein KKA53_02165 [Candidatus Dependentiae bacterium]|nr:hypothetical protein [Candidatus Dependentiae bacterium]
MTFGIVLKSFLPHKHKLSVLTRSNGKVMLVIKPSRMQRTFSAGTSMQFFSKKGARFLVAEKLEIISVPALLNESSICWVHHIIEIVYYFSPLGSPCPDLFRLIHCCLALSSCHAVFEPYFIIIEKICLVRLFMLLGFYPERRLVFFGGLFDQVVSLSLDSSNTEKVRSLHVLLADVSQDDCRRADKWLWLCLQEHPNVEKFKTLSFLEYVVGNRRD